MKPQTDSHLENEQIILCPDCDLAIKYVPITEGKRLLCPRCERNLISPVSNSVEKTLALSIAGLLLFVPAIFLPLLDFDVIGLESSGSIWDSAIALVNSGFYFSGIAVFITSIFVPLLKLLILLQVSFQLYISKAGVLTIYLFRTYKHLDEWGMLEVYMISVLVTIVKMLHMARIQYDTGFICFILLLIFTIFSSLFLDEHFFWKEIYKITANKTKSSPSFSQAKRQES